METIEKNIKEKVDSKFGHDVMCILEELFDDIDIGDDDKFQNDMESLASVLISLEEYRRARYAIEL